MSKKRLPSIAPNYARKAKAMKELKRVLSLLGYPSMRPGQSQIVGSVLEGRDTLALLPTSGGKTACWLIPALTLDQRVVIFSPLISLMQDQVDQLREMGVNAAKLSGDQNDAVNNLTYLQWTEGEVKILFTAPERMRSDDFVRAMRMMGPQMVVIDEAHTIAQWGDTFRTAYAALGAFVEDHPSIETVLAMTATATDDVVESILSTLRLPQLNKVVYLPPRPNLNYSSAPFPTYDGVDRNEVAAVEAIAKLAERGPTIVYCATQKNVESVQMALAKLPSKTPGVSRFRVGAYHGDLHADYKRTTLEKFIADELDIVVATNAFGMGINKPNVRVVVHYDNPGSVDSCVQEWGRAGRDGLPSWCHSFYSEKACNVQRFLIRSSYPDARDVNKFYSYVKTHADADNKMTGRVKDIAKALGMDDGTVSTMTKILEKAGALEREKIESDICLISFNRADGDPDVGKVYPKYRAACVKFGKDVGEASSISLATLAKQVEVTEATVRSKLNEWHKAGMIVFSPPPKGNNYTVKRDIKGLNFEKLDRQRKEKLLGLDKLVALLHVPDHEKSGFIQSYFRQDGESVVGGTANA